ncbi:MAG: hypothetical protein ACRD0S_07940, partial [Acidimicrobiales bacterium]
LVEGGAAIHAGVIRVAADNRNDFKVAADCEPCGPSYRAFGAAVAVSDVESSAVARLGGQADGGEDADGNPLDASSVTVEATSVNVNNDTLARANVAFSPVNSPASTRITATKPPSHSFQMAAAVVFVASSNVAEASLGPDAVVFAGELFVTARAEDNYKTIAIGAAAAGAKFAIAGALAFADHVNQADARIGAGAEVTVDGPVEVFAQAIIPNQLEIDDDLRRMLELELDLPLPNLNTSDPAAFFTSIKDYIDSDPQARAEQDLADLLADLELLKDYLRGNLVLPNKIATTYVSASAAKDNTQVQSPGGSQQTTQFAISGAFSFLTLSNQADAALDAGANLHIRGPPAAALVPASVDANDDRIGVSGNHNLSTGDALVYRSGTAIIPGLVDGTTYYLTAIIGVPNAFRLAETREHALWGRAIDLGAASGSLSSATFRPPGVHVGAEAIYENVDIVGLSSIFSVYGKLQAGQLATAKAQGSAVGV